MAKKKSVPAKKGTKKAATKLPTKSQPKAKLKKPVPAVKKPIKKPKPLQKAKSQWEVKGNSLDAVVQKVPVVKKKPRVVNEQPSLFSEPENEVVPVVVEKAAKKPRAPRKIKDPFAAEAKNSQHFLEKLEATPSVNQSSLSMADELQLLINKYLVTEKGKESEETSAMVRAKIDCHGLTGGPILGVMRDLQQAIKVKPGFYKQLKNLEDDYNATLAVTV